MKSRKKSTKKKKRLSTFLNDPLDSIVTHAGKFLDRAETDDILSAAAAAFCAYAGVKAAYPSGNPELIAAGGASGILGFQLTKSPNLAAGIAGVSILTALGLINAAPLLGQLGEGLQAMKDDLAAANYPQWFLDFKPADSVFGSAANFGKWLGYKLAVAMGMIPEGEPKTIGVPVMDSGAGGVGYDPSIPVQWPIDVYPPSPAPWEPPAPITPPYVPPDPDPDPYIPPTPEPEPTPEPQFIIHKRKEGMYCFTCTSCGATICSTSEESREINMNYHTHDPLPPE